jgi:Transport and Golgi organisation 2
VCTVTFIPKKNGFYITSNRDEKVTRKPAIAPTLYRHNHVQLVYPKDANAGGTWIAVAQNGNAAVLLNGAFKKHISMPPYQKSRGVIFLEIIASVEPYLHFLQISLRDIEPFTLIVYSNSQLYECRWDGKIKHHKQLDKKIPQIWSSATLYEDSVVQKREQWFFDWYGKNSCPTKNDILNFHQFTGDGDIQNDLLMNRNDTTFTVSITCIDYATDKALINYYDVETKQPSQTSILFSPIQQLISV